MKVIAVIPARSGSKGLLNKNIKKINGIPLMGYTIKSALNSGVFDTVHVSTDSIIYKNVGIRYGADVPFLRSKKNSSDGSSSWDVVKEVVSKYSEKGKKFDIIMLLQPTSPLRNKNDIINAYNYFLKAKARTLTSVVESDHPAQWCFELNQDCKMDNFCNSSFKNARRQELRKTFHENGAIYICYVDDLLKDNFDFYSDRCFAYIMDRKNSIDIDTDLDFEIAKILLRREKDDKREK